MSRIFWGFLFVMIHINITAGNSVIQILPDFIGFFLILGGVDALKDLAPGFEKIRGWVFLMALLETAVWLFSLMGLFPPNRPVTVITSIVLLAIGLYIQYYTVVGIREMEEAQKIDLSSARLLSMWKITAVCSVISYIGSFLNWLRAIFIILSVIADLAFLYYLWQAKTVYEQAG